MEDHAFYLNRCLELAQIAAGVGESAVGCVIVKDGIIIGEGSEQSRRLKDVTRHAEVVVVLDAVHTHGSGSCEGASLYSNVEPCILCAYVIRHYKIAHVVFSNYCGELGGTAQPFNMLTTDVIKKWGPAPFVEVLSYGK
ncbi:nucleoside deaminase [Chitinophaga sp. LS1]|uniref:nucleoside deaminase n=1 Tax=Chitinophaga sp. LS1 TaxID=3051176 RepID=UPI002AAB8BB0|nr:deaminase [Chitinophaga sp. LS1]WPV66100.1 deaminase [Chitinophaga sp. LS1]